MYDISLLYTTITVVCNLLSTDQMMSLCRRSFQLRLGRYRWQYHCGSRALSFQGIQPTEPNTFNTVLHIHHYIFLLVILLDPDCCEAERLLLLATTELQGFPVGRCVGTVCDWRLSECTCSLLAGKLLEFLSRLRACDRRSRRTPLPRDQEQVLSF